MTRFPAFLLSLVVVASFFPEVALSQDSVVVRPATRMVNADWFGLTYREVDRPRVALVLSGGGARGIAQIGVLKAIEKHGIPVDFIAATSLGAVVGGLSAAGYSAAELESLAIATDWDEVLSLTGDTKRTDLFVEQKKESDRTFFSLRFEGFEPVLPEAVSSGQRLTNFLSVLDLQAVYHSDSTFDDLRIPFRAVSTDLITGKRVVMKSGSLAEALRASSTVPLLFNPVEKDSLRLVDGGLVSNIPVDIAREAGCDLVIAVNTTSGMRRGDELNAPWQTADQIMSIMMQFVNKEQLELADIVLTPDLGRHLSSDFSGLDSLIRMGEESTEAMINRFHVLYDSVDAAKGGPDKVFPAAVVERRGTWSTDSTWAALWVRIQSGTRSMSDIRKNLNSLFSTGELDDASATVFTSGNEVRVVYTIVSNPVIRDVRFTGVTQISEERFRAHCFSLLNNPLNHPAVIAALEDVLREYRRDGYSLARVQRVSMDRETGILHVEVSEGTIGKIHVEGAERTEDYVVLREFPLGEGEVFQVDKVRQGIASIAGTTLFEYVHVIIGYDKAKPDLTIRLRERPSQLLSLGIRSDNERNLQGLLEIRDDNLGGTGSTLGMSISGGSRNQEYILDYHSHRLFSSSLSFRIDLFLRVMDSYFYQDAMVTEPNTWEREEVGEYRDRRHGGTVALGTQIEKIGNAFVEFSLQDVKVKDKENLPSIQQEYDLSMVRVGTVVDSKNDYPFPTEGVGMDFSFEFALEDFLGGDVSYNALRAQYESFLTWGKRHTVHPILTVGLADETMPFGEQFRLGGRETMFGTREDDRRGRQLLLFNLEYRFLFPFQVLFDTYFHLRYDLGTISEIPEQIKFSAFRHGVGAELSLDTPIGPAFVGAGKSFFFQEGPSGNSIQHGPVLFYFMIGYQL